MYLLSPSIYAADYMKLHDQLQEMEQAGVTRLHVDIMDGTFVPNLSFGPDFVQALRAETTMELDVHLMVEEPGRMLKAFAEAGADILTVHDEACKNTAEVLEEIHRLGKRAGVVLKPETPLKSLPPEVWKLLDVIQIMTVQPGLKGQKFLIPMLNKISEARTIITESGRSIQVEVDGDIGGDRLSQVVTAGADVVVVGKALFSGSLTENIRIYQGFNERQEERIS